MRRGALRAEEKTEQGALGVGVVELGHGGAGITEVRER